MISLLIGLILTATFQAPEATAATYYPLEIGMQWTYSVKNTKNKAIVKVVGIEKIGVDECYKLETYINDTLKQTEYISSKNDCKFRTKIDETLVNPPVPFLKNGAKKGDIWKHMFSLGEEKANTSFFVDFEDVEVPVGSYKNAMLIETRIETSVESVTQQIKSKSWFVKDVGMVRQELQVEKNTITLTLESFDKVKK